ncbi:6760_t:CDS:2, partial [Acaulospora colombiana]
ADYPVWTCCYTSSYEDRVAVMFFEGDWETRRGAGLVIDCKVSKVIMPYMLVKEIEFLSRDEALLLFHSEEDVTSIAVYSFPLQRILCRCQFPFPKSPSNVQFETRADSRVQDNRPVSLGRSFIADPQMCTSLLKKHPGRTSFQWEEWGPTVTRWIPSAIKATGGDNVYGCRMIAWGDPSVLHPQCWWSPSLILLDFNPRPIRRGATTRIQGESQEIVIDQETIITEAHTGVLIKSSLPYRAFTTSWFVNAATYRFDGTTIVERGYNSIFMTVPIVSTHNSLWNPPRNDFRGVKNLDVHGHSESGSIDHASFAFALMYFNYSRRSSRVLQTNNSRSQFRKPFNSKFSFESLWMSLTAVERIPVEIWRQILECAIASPLLPFTEQGTPLSGFLEHEEYLQTLIPNVAILILPALQTSSLRVLMPLLNLVALSLDCPLPRLQSALSGKSG